LRRPEPPATLAELTAHLGVLERSSGIHVEVETLPRDATAALLKRKLRSGSGPDVFDWGTGPDEVGALADAGLLHDVGDAYRRYDWPIYDPARSAVSVDGRPVGVPGDLEALGLFYNKDLLSRLGIAPPESLRALRAAATRIREAGVVPLAVGDQEGWEGGQLLSMALASEVGSQRVAELLDGDRPWGSPEVVRALQVWKDLNVAGDLPRSPATVGHDDAMALFYSGDAAMLPGDSSLVTGIEDSTDFEVGFVPFPAENGPGVLSGAVRSGSFVSAASKNVGAAYRLLDLLLSPTHARWTVGTGHAIPPVPVAIEGTGVSPLLGQVLADTARAADGSEGLVTTIDSASSEAFNKAMYDGVQRLLSGRSNARTVTRKLQAASRG
jgi:raffinose/stachyose/melibiose transport system substrate-binding protein